MGRASTITFLLAVGALGLALSSPCQAIEPEARVAAKPVCLPPGEAREEIKAKHLVEPFAVLKSAQMQFKGEALSAKLCRLGDEFVYEIALLHGNGRYVHVVANAATGKFLENRRGREPVPKETVPKEPAPKEPAPKEPMSKM
jgi:hypothetical protein